MQRNNKLVWDETRLIMQDLFDTVWGDRAEIAVEHAVDVTLPVRTSLLSLLTATDVLTRAVLCRFAVPSCPCPALVPVRFDLV